MRHDLNRTNILLYLDGWRGIAIIMVFVAHFGTKWNASWIGELGVQLFFVLSGYLMSNLLFIKHAELSMFFWRRLSRVLPTFILFVLAMAIYAYMRSASPPGLAEIVATLAFLRTYFPGDISIWESGWEIGNLWSLNVEEHSYAYLAAVALIARATGRKSVSIALLVLSVGGIFCTVFYYRQHPPAGASPWFLRSECAALGLVSAATIRVVREYILCSFWRLDSVFAACGIVIATLCYSTYQHKGVHLTVAPLALAIGINYLDRAPQIFKGLFSSRVLCWFGTCSFSLYLWQQPFYRAAKAGEIPEWLGLSLAVLLGLASFYLVESPARTWLNERGWRATRTNRAEEIKPQKAA